jgi:hypothetical protein
MGQAADLDSLGLMRCPGGYGDLKPLITRLAAPVLQEQAQVLGLTLPPSRSDPLARFPQSPHSVRNAFGDLVNQRRRWRVPWSAEPDGDTLQESTGRQPN